MAPRLELKCFLFQLRSVLILIRFVVGCEIITKEKKKEKCEPKKQRINGTLMHFLSFHLMENKVIYLSE